MNLNLFGRNYLVLYEGQSWKTIIQFGKDHMLSRLLSVHLMTNFAVASTHSNPPQSHDQCAFVLPSLRRSRSLENIRTWIRPQTRLALHSRLNPINNQIGKQDLSAYHFVQTMREVVRQETRLKSTSDDEPREKSYSLEKNLEHLKSLRDTQIEERYQKLSALPAKIRRKLFESGETANQLIHQLIEENDWKKFKLDGCAVSGIYPYALLARLPYQCYLRDEEWITLRSGYESLSKAGFTVHALHEAEPQSTVEKECNRVLLFIKGNEVVISIRGTQVISDWDVNLNFLSSIDDKQELPGNYHSGYLDTFKKLWPHVKHALEVLIDPSPHVVINVGIVGYSMGGPLALMFAMQLHQDKQYDVKKVVTLGGVRGFGSDASKAYEEKGLSEITTRVINYADIVPLGWPNLTHPNSDRLFLTINGKYWINPSPFAVVFNQCQRFFPKETHGYDWISRETYDHDLVSYAKILLIHSNDEEYYIPETLSSKGPESGKTSSNIDKREEPNSDKNSDDAQGFTSGLDDHLDGLETGKPKAGGWFNWYPSKKNDDLNKHQELPNKDD